MFILKFLNLLDWSERYNTWEPIGNILDHRLIEQYEKKSVDSKKQTIKKDDKQSPKIDKRYLDKIAKLSKSSDELKLINSNAPFKLSANECLINKSKDEVDANVRKGNLIDLNKSIDNQKTDNDSSKSIDFDLLNNDLPTNLSESTLPLHDDLNISSNSLNDSTDDEADSSNSNDNLIIDSRSSDNSVDKSSINSNSDKPNNLKRKFDSVDLVDNGNISVKYQNKEHIDFLVKQINAKVNQSNDQIVVKKILDNGQQSENSVYPSNLISNKFNCVKSDELSFQDLLSANYSNNKVRSYKPEFLKKKSNLLDQVVITDVTVNNTTITVREVRESKSQKFFFKDNKKVQM